MMKKETIEMKEQDNQDMLVSQLEELEIRLEEKQGRQAEVHEELKRYESEFSTGEAIIQSLKTTIRTMRAGIRAVPAYLLGRRNPKQLYSRAYKQKAAENKLKMYKKYLYDLGFEERALSDLQDLYYTTDEPYVKSALAWELGLYYANQLDPRKAPFTIKFLSEALGKQIEPERARKIAILQAEALEMLGREEEANELLTDLLDEAIHPDLYIALANLEETPSERLKWINHVLQYYDLQEITLNREIEKDAYYQLTTDPIQRKQVTTGPKVTVIIPAYHAESGIRVALDSLLNQTWENLELLVVDDCSTDQTSETVREYVEKDDRVQLLSTKENSGPYIARNIGLAHATGEFITVNDADDWSHPEKIQIQVEHLLESPEVIANTSLHARLTEHLKPYRRSMPGKYIFSNMSSLMFRKEPVLERIGYWDEVRFAADSEFKNRLIKEFGKDAVVDVQTGPLSFPMQSSNSLTASSTFGYAGFLMGVRKEYRESYGHFHQEATSKVLPKEPEERCFPVPEPMLPKQTTKNGGSRKLDVTIIADFREKPAPHFLMQMETLKRIGMKVGLIQMGTYDLKIKPAIDSTIRDLIDGERVQMLVYGERIACDLLLIYNPAVFNEKQKYVPEVTAAFVRVILTDLPGKQVGQDGSEHYNLRECSRRIDAFAGVKSKWYPLDEALRENLNETHRSELQSIPLSIKNWIPETKNETSFTTFIENWLVEENPYQLERGDNGEGEPRDSSK